VLLPSPGPEPVPGAARLGAARSRRVREPGARWLRCDLHARTHLDPDGKFGDDLRSALAAFRELSSGELDELAARFAAACRQGAEGHGLDLVVLADPSSAEGWRRLRPRLEQLSARAAAEGWPMPAVLPGLELLAGSVRFVAVFGAGTEADELDRLMGHLLDGGEPFDEAGGPRPVAAGAAELLRRFHRFCRPPGEERALGFVLLLCGPAQTAGAEDEIAQAAAWAELRSALGPSSGAPAQLWHGFESRAPLHRLPPPLKELAARWDAAREGLDWEALPAGRRAAYARRVHWPLVEASDPWRGELPGTGYTWLKLELPDVEGIRLALLDPESRLRPRSAGPPGQGHPYIRRMALRRTDFFEELLLPFSPCLTNLIGGRGCGKSTVLECLRFALDRARPEDFQEYEEPVREAVDALRAGKKRARDFGETPGIFLPGSEIELELTVAGRDYRVLWSSSDPRPRVVPEPDDGAGGHGALDVRALVAPRILSQGQIAQIARDPAAQRRELDALLDPEWVRQYQSRRRTLEDELSRLQLRRQKLVDRQASLPARETELRRVRDQIELLERGGNRETLELYEAVQHEKAWLDALARALESVGRETRRSAEAAKKALEPLGPAPQGPGHSWTEQFLRRGRDVAGEAARALEKQARSLEALREELRQERNASWKPLARLVRSRYTQLRREMEAGGIDFSQHEKLLEQRAQLEREVAELGGLATELGRVLDTLAETWSRLTALGRDRQERRRALARALEEQDADVRMELLPFGDRRELLAQRERWFAGTGLREQDWELLVDFVHGGPGETAPERLLALAAAMRLDAGKTREAGGSLDAASSKVVRLLGAERASRMSRHFFKALQQGGRIRLDEMERFLLEDLVVTRVRAADGSFRPVTQGSVGQRSTAVLSLLLSAGDQPLIIDQPEDDLDNQYVYSAVVGLLRRQKFARQLVIATHNANIPVNGDAELIVALGVRGEERLGRVLAAGSIDRAEVKAQVSAIMEGSAEAFRRRRERYGY
jgi:hypothetical protein